jgi:serine/threonine protein kinase
MNEADLFLLAIEIDDPNARDSFLNQHCGNDLKLRQRIERLLRASATDDAFLETPVLEKVSLERNASGQVSVGDSIGPYTLVDSLGEGGMGTVFLADQRAPIQRTVAIKVIKPGMDSEQVLARFNTERQAISMMNHPNIAQAFEVGTTDQGRPYFVMELVDGVPISRYCDEHRFNIHQRLELFVPVCEAVQHAHQKGIIHRDLKPSNVLVTGIENRSVPKIIDFGIAKAVSDPSNSQPNLTQFGQIVGTMEYMSPEQSRFNPHDVDTRSDIYSLGALLYELVAGSTPIQAHRLKDLAWDELARWIREEEPVAPSARIAADPNKQSICDLRRATPTQLQRDVRGELDWIVLKALAKDRSRRYQSASDMAKDIQRYLSNEPIEASPPSTTYRLMKYLHRNRLAIGSVAMVTCALLLGLAGTTWQAREASRARAIAEFQRDIARAESQKAREAESAAAREAENVLKQSLYSRAIANFVNHHLLEFTDPDIEPDRNISLRTVLDRAAISIQALNDAPETQAAMRHTLAKSYLSLGEYAEARTHAEAAMELQNSALGETHPESLSTLILRAEIQLRCCEYREANETFTRAVDLCRKSQGDDHVLTLHGVRGQGISWAKLGRLTAARELFQELYRTQSATFGENHLDSLETRRELAEVSAAMGRHHEAIDAFTAIRNVAREKLGNAHPLTLKIESGVAASKIELGQYEDARKILQSVVGATAESLGDLHPETILRKSTLASISMKQGKLDESASLQRKLLAMAEDRLGQKHLITIQIATSLADVLNEQGAIDEAKSLYENALSVSEQLLEPNSLQSLKLRFQSVSNLAFEGNHDEALLRWNEIFEVQKSFYGLSHPDTLRNRSAMAGIWMAQGRYAEAKTVLNEIATTTRDTFGENHPLELQARSKLASIAGLEGKIEECIEWFRSNLDACHKAYGAKSPITIEALINYSESLSRLGFHTQALRIHEELLTAVKEVFGSNHRAIFRVLDGMATSLNALARYDEAKKLSRQLFEVRSKNLGKYHPLTLSSANVLGCCLLNAGNVSEAESFIRGAAEASREHFGADFPTTLQYTQNLATLLSMQKKSDEPIEMFRDLIARMTRTLPPEHAEVLVAKARYAAALSFQKRFHEAKKEYELLLDQYSRILGDDHPNTLICMDNLASVHGAIGEYEQAIRLGEKIVASSVHKYPEMPFTLKAVHGLIEYRILAGLPLASAEELQHAIALRKANNFSLDWMIKDLHHVAIGHLAKNELNESVRLMRELVQICDSQLGPENVNSLVHKVRLAELLKRQQDVSGAQELIEFAKSSLAAKVGNTQDPGPFNSGLEQLRASLSNSPQEVEVIAKAFAARKQWLIAAKLYTQCAMLVPLKQDALTSEESRSTLADETVDFTNQAIAMLRHAVETRVLSNRRVLEWLKLSPDYDLLRSTDEFRMILDQIDRQLQRDLLTEMAWSLARAGEHDRARIMAEKIVSIRLEEKQLDGMEESRMHYKLACIYSRCYESSRRSGEASIQYLSSAIDCFHACARLHFFDTDGIAQLDTDVDLDPIREAEEFQEFVKNIRGE